MFSRVFCIAFALGVTSFATGLVRERRSAYETALKCTKAGWNADVFALRAKGPRVEDGCIYLREFARCIIAIDSAEYSSPFPNIVHFLITFEWQQTYIAEKAGLCKNLMLAELRKMALESGLMERENVKNVDYISCYEDAGYTCNGLMLRHFIGTLKAYRKHLEEKHGKLGKKMADKIPLPPQ